MQAAVAAGLERVFALDRRDVCADVRADDVRRAEPPFVDQAGEELAGAVRRDQLGT
jgi:hypothetical protein